jgi:hypothetical protein
LFVFLWSFVGSYADIKWLKLIISISTYHVVKSVHPMSDRRLDKFAWGLLLLYDPFFVQFTCHWVIVELYAFVVRINLYY